MLPVTGAYLARTAFGNSAVKVFSVKPRAHSQYRPVLQMVSSLSCALEGHQSGLQAYLKEFAGFSFLWQEDIDSHYRKFLENSPTLEVTHRTRPAFNLITPCGGAACF